MHMKKFKYLLSYQLKKRLTSKAFIISNIIIFAAIILVANIGNIINAFQKEPTSKEIFVVNETKDILIVDALNEAYLALISEGVFPSIVFVSSDGYDETLEKTTLIVSKQNGEIVGTLIPHDLSAANEYYISESLGILIIQDWIKDKTQEELDLIEDYQNILNRPYLIVENIEDDTQALEVMSAISMLISLPLFLLIILAIQFLGGSIVEEKSSKAIEYIIANVSPKQHFFAKVLTSLIGLISQALLIMLYGFVGILVSLVIFGQSSGMGMDLNTMLGSTMGFDQAMIDGLIKYLPLTLLFVVLFAGCGSLLLMIIMAFVAAISNSNEEYQQFQSPLMFIILIGFYGSFFGVLFQEGNLLIKIMAYIPVFSPFMVPSLYFAGGFAWWEALISFIILAGSTFLVYKLIMPMYKSSILSYTTDKLTVRIKRAFKRN